MAKRVRYLTAVCIACLLIIAVMPLAMAEQTSLGASATKPSVLWVNYLAFPATADNSSGQWLQPNVADGIVYVGALSAINFGLPLPIPNQPPYNPDNHWSDFYAFNASNGALIWDYKEPTTLMQTNCAVADGLVFFCSGSGIDYHAVNSLKALDAKNGVLLWNYTAEGEISSPVVSNGIVYINNKSTLYALNETNGDKIWQANDYSGTLPVISKGVLYAGSFRNELTDDGFVPRYDMNALNAGNGERLWNYSTEFWVSTPAVSGDRVFFSADTNIYALNANTGEKIWNYTTPHTPRTDGIGDTMTNEYMSPTVSHGIVYIFSTRAGTLLALKSSNGAQLWNCTGGIGGSTDVGGHPTVSDGYVYVKPNVFSVLDAYNGSKVWEYGIDSYHFPVMDAGVAYYGIQNGGFFALKLPAFSSNYVSARDIYARTDMNTEATFPISGNLTGSQFSNSYLTSDESSATTIYLTITGANNSMGFSNITIPKSTIRYGTIPTIYIDDQKAEDQGYTQDADNYYVWFTTHFSTHEVSIEFTGLSAKQNEPFGLLEIAIVVVSVAAAVAAVAAFVFVFRKRKN